ncbi:hypothetical protein [Anoxybacteroides amylolyticum]|uniref:Uncharacterized protein n=1 Tax=Anoxybacteroides amylolyticum TaxID=294699 RepID=A0A160F5A8_9BACL|nr:hypothetical protein [Anoxybacillus amylolyticus]ANB61658.1 hypothetical protein GFC30_1013 [Anoxybacillus amylolyticus]
MLGTLEQIIASITISKQLAGVWLENMDNAWEKEKVAAYVQHEQTQYDIWQYSYFLQKGTYWNKRVEQAVPPEDIVSVLLFYEIKKALLYYEIAKECARSQRWAADQALTKALEHSLFFSNLTRR